MSTPPPSPNKPRAQTSCPACGAPILFKIASSVVVVCEHCHSVIARTDRALQDIGRVAEIAHTESPLQTGMRGVYQGVPFELTGRAQLQHSAGGMWDEWYAAFTNGYWGWLAEAQGRFYLTFQQSLPGALPSFEGLEVGRPAAGIPGSVPLVVTEKAQARAAAAEGEIPYRLVPGETNLYADLSGPSGEFATIDYGEQPPLFYAGREVTLNDLGIAADVRAPEREARRVAAQQLSCPNCAGPLALAAPDKTERVTCPNCGSLLDVNQGKLTFLKALDKNQYKPTIPLGSIGDFEQTKMMVIGAMSRAVQFEGVYYYWEEFLLYNPHIGFRWLVYSDGHWNFVTPVPPGEVTEYNGTADYASKRYKLYQDTLAYVVSVVGEFYWKVETGETVRAADFINAPHMLSKEVAQLVIIDESGKRRSAGGSEINWSHGTYMTSREVERAFNTSGFAGSPSGIAPNQPFRHKMTYVYWLALAGLTFVLGLLFLVTSPNRQVFQQSFQFQPLPNPDGTQIVFSEPIQLAGRNNLRIEATSNVNNSGIYIEGDLINEQSGLVEGFSLPIEYYTGVEDGESWSEGSTSASAHVASLPAGTYILRLEAQWEQWQQPATVNVRLRQGVPRIGLLFLVLFLLSAFPLMMMLYHYSFEKRRWKDSYFSPYQDSSDGSDDE